MTNYWVVVSRAVQIREDNPEMSAIKAFCLALDALHRDEQE